MSDSTTPNKPITSRINHLQAEPVPISFVSPQQLASLTTSGFLNNPQFKSPMPSFMSSINSGFPVVNNTMQQPKSPPPVSPTEASASASPKPVPSSNSNYLTPLPAQEIDLNQFGGHKFVTLDPYQLEQREIYDKVSGTNAWVMCEGCDDRCISVIRDECQKKRVFLITTGGLGAKVVPQIHSLPQVYAIYVYCSDVKGHRKWADNFNKVRVVCDNDDRDLLPQFAVDVAQSNMDWGNALLKAGNKDKAKQKFQNAYDKLNDHVRNHDPAMLAEIQKKLEECK